MQDNVFLDGYFDQILVLSRLLSGKNTYLKSRIRIDTYSFQLSGRADIAKCYKNHLAATCKLIICIGIAVGDTVQGFYTFGQVVARNLYELKLSIR